MPLPEPLTQTQFLVVLASIATLLLFAGYAIVKNWVLSVTKSVESLQKYDERLRRLEAHDFHDLRGRVQALMLDATLDKKDLSDYKLTNDGRVARAETAINETGKTLDSLKSTLDQIEVMVRDMWERRSGTRTP